jgi:hypothetical protein
MWILAFVMRQFGYFRIGSRWLKSGDRVVFTHKDGRKELATVDRLGGLYIIVTTDFD